MRGGKPSIMAVTPTGPPNYNTWNDIRLSACVALLLLLCHCTLEGRLSSGEFSHSHHAKRAREEPHLV